MLRRRQEIPADLRVTNQRPAASELPSGWRMRRVGPAQWVAEPSRYRARLWLTGLVCLLLGAGGGVQFMRIYHLRKSQSAVVIVNGVAIRRDRLALDLERRYGVEIVRRKVTDELIRQFCVSRGAWPTEADVEQRYAVESVRPAFHEERVRAGLTEEDYKARLRVRLAQVNLVIQGVKVTDAEARYFYERNIDPRNPNALFRAPERLQVAVIVTPNAGSAERARLDLMRDVPWPQVVARHSSHPSRNEAGLLPPISRGQTIFARTPAAEKIVFGLKEGARSEPFQAAGQWWIVRCIKRWPASVVPWDKARPEAEMGARIEIGAARNAAAVAKAQADFVRDAVIQVFDPAYDSVSRPVVSGAPDQATSDGPPSRSAP